MDKVRILFVDDEPHVLRGLRRSMIEMEDQWEMVFCGSGADALAILAQYPIDVLVSDIRMPQMDGAQLLNIVRQRHPGTIRIILSGYAESEYVLRTVGPAHVYLAKPCDPVLLRDAISRPLALKRLFSPSLQEVIGKLSNLPSLPDLFVALEEELRSPGVSVGSVAAILAKDMAMTAEILKLTNSAFFALHNRATSPQQAVRILGLELIQVLVLQLGIFRQFSGNLMVKRQLEALNDYGLFLGGLAEKIAAANGGDVTLGKTASCTAMLSCIGGLILLDNDADKYRLALSSVGPDTPLSQAERNFFGVSHHLIGAYLLSLWGFSNATVEAVAFASEPAACAARDNPILTAVHAAYALGPRFPLLLETMNEPEKLDMIYLDRVGKAERTPHWRELAAGCSQKV